MGNNLPTVVDPTIPVTVLLLTSCTPRMVLRCGSRRPVCLLADVLGPGHPSRGVTGGECVGHPSHCSLALPSPSLDGWGSCCKHASIKLGIRVVSSSAHLAGCVV